MATGDYCTLPELKADLWPPGSTPDSTDDVTLENIITSVSRWIDAYTSRRFYTTAADETRYYTAPAGGVLFTDDILSITTLKTDEDGDRTYEITWATTDYDLLPLNASLESQPYSWIEVTPNGAYSFPTSRKGVQIVGKFGYCATASLPQAIQRACLLQCLRIFKRKDAPFGVISNPFGGDMRVLKDLDPDVQALLDPYRRVV